MNDPLININQIQEEAKAEIKEEQPWLLTYADMMTLLFAFFVLLFSMSSPDPVKMSQMQDAMEKASGKPGSLQSLSDIKQELEKIVNELNLETTTNVFSDPRGLILEMDGDICFLSGSVSILKDMEIKYFLQNVGTEQCPHWKEVPHIPRAYHRAPMAHY